MTTFVVQLTSGSSWTVPPGCYLLDSVDCVGAGGSGAAAILHGVQQGGGGGAFSRKNNITVTPGASIPYALGAGGIAVQVIGNNNGIPAASNGVNGGDTWFINNVTVLAKGGSGGIFNAPANTPALGGSAASGVGDVRYDGGNSGYSTNSSLRVATGGGSSASISGPGVAGGTATTSQATTGGIGGSGNGSDGAWATSGASATAATGGSYGGGGGASTTDNNGFPVSTSGAGGSGLITITYTIANPTGFNMPMLGM